MSFRPLVDRARIERFFGELGRSFRQPARIYIVGGATLVYENLRRATLDIDVTIEVDDAFHGDLMRQIARLKDHIPVNVELVSPADYIPLPSGWRERSPYVGRFGQIDVFHFDLVSTSLSKLLRGHEGDLVAVRTLLASDLLSAEDLEVGFGEIKAKLPDRGRSISEIAEFEENVRLVLDMRGD
jgi:hypothetical protein